MDDMRLLVSLVNWHLTLRLEHSEQLEVSVASHCGHSQLYQVRSEFIVLSDLDLAFSTSIAAGVFPALSVRPLMTLGRIPRYSRPSCHHAVQSELVLMHHLIVIRSIARLRISNRRHMYGWREGQPTGTLRPAEDLRTQQSHAREWATRALRRKSRWCGRRVVRCSCAWKRSRWFGYRSRCRT